MTFPYRRRSKYGAIKTTVDGITFASKREARVYQELKLRERAGELKIMSMQTPYVFDHGGVKICKYVADFVVDYLSGLMAGTVAVIDAKGVKTPAYRIKKKLMKAFYGIEIVEI